MKPCSNKKESITPVSVSDSRMMNLIYINFKNLAYRTITHLVHTQTHTPYENNITNHFHLRYLFNNFYQLMH